MTKLAQQLRNATQDSHRRLDSNPLLRPLTRADISTQAYADALAALHGPLQQLEQCLARYQQIGDEVQLAYSWRCPALEQDLRQLQRAPFPYRGPDLMVDRRSALIGTLYVLEGARLGGQAISRRLRQNRPDLPDHFFNHTTSPGWPSYWLPLLDSVDQADQVLVIHAAKQAFAVFSDHLETLALDLCVVTPHS